MSGLSKRDVLHVAKLAKLDISPQEEKKFVDQLSEVISYVGQLNEVDTEGVEPTSQTTGLEDVTRNDQVDPERILTREEALGGTDKTHNGYFVASALLEERGEK